MNNPLQPTVVISLLHTASVCLGSRIVQALHGDLEKLHPKLCFREQNKKPVQRFLLLAIMGVGRLSDLTESVTEATSRI